MTLIAGYYRSAGPLQADSLRARLNSFRISPLVEDSATVRTCHDFRQGHLFTIAGQEGPCQTQTKQDNVGNLLALHGYQLSGDSAEARFSSAINSQGQSLESTEGEFVAVLVDQRIGTVHLVNDRFGARPFYLFQAADYIAFSSSPSLLRHLFQLRFRPDPLGWAQLLAHSHTLTPTTTFAGLSRLLPGVHIQLDRQGLRQRQYWKLSYDVQTDRSPAEVSSSTFSAFQSGTAARASLSEQLFVPLSGGLDSRLIAACTPPESQCRFFTFNNSTEQQETTEVSVARQVAQILNREHFLLPTANSDPLSSSIDDIIWTRGGQKLAHHCIGGDLIHQSEFDNRLRFNGTPGDGLAGEYPIELGYINPARIEEMLEHFHQAYQRHLTPLQTLFQIMRPDLAYDLSGKVKARLQQTLMESNGPTAAHKVTAWCQTFRQPGFTLISRINNVTNRADACPHLGYAYCEQMLTLPADWLFQRNFYRFMIQDQIPELRAVIYANTGQVLPSKMIQYVDETSTDSLNWKKKLKGLMKNRVPRRALEFLQSRRSAATEIPQRPEASKPVPMGQDFHYDVIHQDEVLLNRLETWLQEDSTAKEFLDTSGCISFLEAFRERRLFKGSVGRDRELMGGLITLCVGQELLG